MPNFSKNHEDCRKSVCVLCLKKCSRELTQFLVEKILKHFHTSLDLTDTRVPRGICDSCRTILRRKDEGKDVNLPTLFPFSSIKVRPPTRDQGCNCLICQVGHLKLNEKSPVDYSKPVEDCTPQRCGDCLSLVGRGLPHQCTPFTFRENLK